MAYNKFKKLDN